MTSPDSHSSGFLATAPDALRYEYLSLDPDDAGMKLTNLIELNSRVLDVGCGTGVVTNIIRCEKSASIIGIEPDAERVQRAVARGLDVHLGVLSPDFIRQHGPFDYIVFADVLEHLPNPAEIVAMARGGLKPGGSVVASIPNVAHWSVRLDLLRGRFEYQPFGIRDATHLRWFTADSVRSLFETNGLRVISLQHTAGVGLPDYENRRPWRWMSRNHQDAIVRALARRLPLLFGCQHIIHATPA